MYTYKHIYVLIATESLTFFLHQFITQRCIFILFSRIDGRLSIGKHLSIQYNALICHIFDTWWFEYALFTWLDKIRININILAILTNCALWMECYLAMQNEAIDHEKFLKGGMCNIYLYSTYIYPNWHLFQQI